MAVRQRPAREAPGQHFLRSSRLASGLVREAGVARGDLVVDVGAGSGVLTRALADAGARVLALEIDPPLARELQRRFRSNPRVTVLQIDALRFEWPDDPFAVVANFPFTGSSELLGRLLRNPANSLLQADVIVQWEVAAKHSAIWPATLRGAYWRAWFDLSIVARLARTAFTPTPAVNAAILRIRRRANPLVRVDESDCYWRFLTEAFRTRGPLARGIRSHLTPTQVRRVADVHGFSPDAHARDLDAVQWARLFAVAPHRVR